MTCVALGYSKRDRSDGEAVGIPSQGLDGLHMLLGVGPHLGDFRWGQPYLSHEG